MSFIPKGIPTANAAPNALQQADLEKLEKIDIEFRFPMRNLLSTLDTSKHENLDGVRTKIQQVELLSMQLLNQLERLQEETKNSSVFVAHQFRETLSVSQTGQNAIKSHLVPTDEIPTHFFLSAVSRMEHRFQIIEEEITQFSKQLNEFDGLDRTPNKYGIHRKIGADQLVELLQRQHSYFVRIAANLGKVHAEKEKLCQDYIQKFGTNPFREADKAEQILKSVEESNLSDRVNKINPPSRDASQPAGGAGVFGFGGVGGAAGGFGASFGAPAAAGGFGTPATATKAVGFGPAPAAAAAGGGFGAGFGAPAPGGGFGAGFGAPTVGGGFGTPATATKAVGFGPAPAAAAGGGFGAPAVGGGFGAGFGAPAPGGGFGAGFGAPTVGGGLDFAAAGQKPKSKTKK